MTDLRTLLFPLLLATTLAAQPNPFRWYRAPLEGKQYLEYRLEVPSGASPTKPTPFLILLVGGKQDRAAVYDEMAGNWWQPALSRGWILLAPVAPASRRFDATNVSTLTRVLSSLRARSAIQGNKIHLASVGDGFESAVEVMARFGFEFASLTVVNPTEAPEKVLSKLPRMTSTSVSILSEGEGDAPTGFSKQLLTRLESAGVQAKWLQMPSFDTDIIWKNIGEEAKKLIHPKTPEGDAHGLLDRWHTAAAKADEDGYFGAFTEDAVFMGTDATERWDLTSFRTWAAPYFKRESAWILVPTQRHLAFSRSGDLAWFDEVVWSASYGQCRGSGVLEKIDGNWKIAHYNLALPVPNDLMNGIVHGIRSWQEVLEGGRPAKAAFLPRTIYIVRHAEKIIGDSDPELTPAGLQRAKALAKLLPSRELDLILATEFKRTRATVAPAAEISGKNIEIVPAGDTAALVDRVTRLDPGQTALVAGHSNTIGQILTALGLEEKVTITEQQHDDLFVVTLNHAGTASLQRLQHRPSTQRAAESAGKK